MKRTVYESKYFVSTWLLHKQVAGFDDSMGHLKLKALLTPNVKQQLH